VALRDVDELREYIQTNNPYPECYTFKPTAVRMIYFQGL
jgi:hypothetical protein